MKASALLRPERETGRAIPVRGFRWLRFIGAAAVWFGAVACVHQADGDAEREIRAHIASIRAAILAQDATGIVRYGTPDWRFTGPDGKTYDRAAYLARTTALFAKIEAIESLDTHVDRVAVEGDRADVELTQTMIRRERGEAGAASTRLWLRYREHHVWRRRADGWRVESVAFLGAPERKTLPAAE